MMRSTKMPGVWIWSGSSSPISTSCSTSATQTLPQLAIIGLKFRGFPENEVAGLVALPHLHERKLGRDAGFEYVFLAVKNFGFLALSQVGAETGACVESRDPRATRTQPLRERALGNELEFKFTRQHLTLELLVLANVRGQDFFHLPCGEQNSHSETIDASVVANNGQALHAVVAQRRDQIFRNAAQPEPARSDRHVVLKQAVKRGGGVRINFVHAEEI